MSRIPTAFSADRCFSSALFAISFFTLLGAPVSAQGQSPLRWKLKAGQSLVVDVQQQTSSKVSFSGKSADTKIDLGMELHWTVASADEKEIKIKQTIARITFLLESQKAGTIQYDSAEKGRPTGQARQVADAVKPLLGAEVEITMTPRGQIVTTAPVNAAAEKLFADVSGPQADHVFSKKALQTLLRQPLVVLPEEAVAPEKTWLDEPRKVDSAAGVFDQTTEYRHAGQVEEEGQKLDKLELTAKLAPALTAAGKTPKLTVKSHEQSGTILFSADQGRLVRAEQTQKLATERPYRETTIAVSLESKQTTTIKPAGERTSTPE